MPGWYRACPIGRSEQQVQLQHLLHFEFRVYVWLVHSCVQFAVSADKGGGVAVGGAGKGWQWQGVGYQGVGLRGQQPHPS